MDKKKLLKLESEKRTLEFGVMTKQPDYLSAAFGVVGSPCAVIGLVYDNYTFLFIGVVCLVLCVLSLVNKQEKHNTILNRIEQLEQEILKLKIEALESNS